MFHLWEKKDIWLKNKDMVGRQNKNNKIGNSRWRFWAELKWILLPLMPCCSRFLGNPSTACCVIVVNTPNKMQSRVKNKTTFQGRLQKSSFRDGTQQYGYYTVLNMHTGTGQMMGQNLSFSVHIFLKKHFWQIFLNLHNGASADSGMGTTHFKENNNLKEAAKDGLDVMLFIAGETPTQPISLVCSWLKTTLERIPLTCPHNHTLSTGPHQQAWRNELVHRVHKNQIHFHTVHHYGIKITGDALKVCWK